MNELLYLDLTGTDAARNLATEELVFDRLPEGKTLFMLWQNRSAVIIGKYQNTLAEIDLDYVRAQGIQVVRRLSGGGAVYHDLGNLNYTIITRAKDPARLDLALFCQPVLRTLRQLGVPAELNGRNDMSILGQKFSGNAQYMRRGKVMHHGTILFDSDLSVVSRALRVDPEKIRAKGVGSVRSRVTNVRPHLKSDLSLPEFRARLLENLLQDSPGQAWELNEEELAAIEALRESRYDSWDWNFGASRECSLLRRRRIEGCGTVEARISLEHGLITGLDFRGDFFSLEEPEVLARRFLGLRPERDDYAGALGDVDVSRYFLGLDAPGLIDLLCES